MRLSRYALPRAAASRRPCTVPFTPVKRALALQRFESSGASHDSKISLVKSSASSLSSSPPFRVLRRAQPDSSSQSAEPHQTIRQRRLKRLSLSPYTPLSSLRSRIIRPPDLSDQSTSPYQIVWRKRVGPRRYKPLSSLRFPILHPPESDLSSLRYRIIRQKRLTSSTVPKSSWVAPTHGAHDRTSIPHLPTARINRSNEGGPKLELAVPIVGLSQNLVTAFNTTGIDRDNQAFSIAIDTIKNGSHTRYVARRKITRLPDTVPGTTETNKSEIFKNWQATLRRLERMTAVPSIDWTETTITGVEWHLLELYHYVLSTFPYRAIPAYPVIALGHGSMSISGEEECIHQVQLRYSEMKKETDESADIISEAPNYLFNTKEGTSAVPQSVADGDASNEYVLNDMQYPPEDQYPSFFQSKSRFSKYIKALTQLWKPRMITRAAPYKTDWMESWIQDTVHRLLFDSNLTRPFVSFVALHRGLSFLVEKRKSRNGLRFIAEMEKNRVSTKRRILQYNLAAVRKMARLQCSGQDFGRNESSRYCTE